MYFVSHLLIHLTAPFFEAAMKQHFIFPAQMGFCIHPVPNLQIIRQLHINLHFFATNCKFSEQDHLWLPITLPNWFRISRVHIICLCQNTGCPKKSTFPKFQVYKSIFSATLDPSNGLYWSIWIIWTAMDCWTISYNFVCFVGP